MTTGFSLLTSHFSPSPRPSVQRLCILILLASSSGIALAQTPATRPATALPPIPREPEYAGSERVTERMINEQAGRSIVLPSEPRDFCDDPALASGTVVGKVTAGPRPLPEGYVIARRPARIERQSTGFVVHVEPDPRLPAVPPLRVLPNARLALLETVLAETGEDHRFLVTGRVTEFQGANYLLLSNVAELPPGVDPSPQPPAPPAPVPDASQSDGQTETRPSGREPTAEELIRQMMQDRPPRPAALPEDRPPTGTAPMEIPLEKPLPAVPETERARWPDDTLLSDRPVRLVPGENGDWMLAFENRSMRPMDGPIHVLPGRLLERAISLTAGGTKPVVLIVSGEITAHRGTNYILLRKVLVRRSVGNLH
ncbi:MAG TPA: hypothetical protein PK235_05260 [Phycisphaerae bacterium]|jgi:hypothetical protein|nr:hypothetical protein [Phycisphaerae bacterium]